MAKRDIIIHPDPRLKKTADPVGEITPDHRRLAEDMLETMYDAPGIGLAAPQVGVLQRLVVLDCVKEEGAPPRPLIMFNPEIVSASEETSVYEEGCLSIPEQFAEVTRPAALFSLQSKAGPNFCRLYGNCISARQLQILQFCGTPSF